MLRILLSFSVALACLAEPARAQDAAAEALEGAWVVSVGDQKDRFMILGGLKSEQGEIRVGSSVFGWVDGKGKPVENWKASIVGDTIALSFETPGGAQVGAALKAGENSVIGDWTSRNGKKFRFRMTRLDQEELAAMRAAAVSAKSEERKKFGLTKGSMIALLYVGADNCPSCVRFINRVGTDGKNLKDIAPELAEARFVYAHLWEFRDPVTREVLPADMAWLAQPAAGGKMPIRKRGTPFFAAVVDHRVIAQGHGTAALEHLVAPAIKRALEEKRAAN